jgi:hypothetical protein
MTAYDLDTLTLTNIGEDATDENRLAYSPQLLVYYNEAYFSICAGTLKPTAGQLVALDGDRKFSPDGLENRLAPGGVVSVKANENFSHALTYAVAPEYAFLWTEDGHIVVPGAKENATVYVTYRFLPYPLENPTPVIPGSGTSPELLPDQYQGALASYAAAALFRVRRKFERMQVWMETFLSAVQEMQGRADSSTRMLRNIYVPMP